MAKTLRVTPHNLEDIPSTYMEVTAIQVGGNGEKIKATVYFGQEVPLPTNELICYSTRNGAGIFFFTSRIDLLNTLHAHGWDFVSYIKRKEIVNPIDAKVEYKLVGCYLMKKRD